MSNKNFLSLVMLFLSLVILFLLLAKEFLGITLLKDYWCFYLIGILFIILSRKLSRKSATLKKLIIVICVVVGVTILLSIFLGKWSTSYYNYTYSPDYQHRLVLKEINSGKKRGGSILEVHKQFGLLKKKKGSIYIKRLKAPLTLELFKRNGNVFEPKKEFNVAGIHFFWETNDILKVECICGQPFKTEDDKPSKATIVLR